jgi:Restriction endonuclease NaeI
VAKQDDYMKRVRAGGGARDQLRGEGIVIFGDYAGDQALAAALGLPRPGPGEFVSARLTRYDGSADDGGPARTGGGERTRPGGGEPTRPSDGERTRPGGGCWIRLEGADWTLAAPTDPPEPAPRLPRQ